MLPLTFTFGQDSVVSDSCTMTVAKSMPTLLLLQRSLFFKTLARVHYSALLSVVKMADFAADFDEYLLAGVNSSAGKSRFYTAFRTINVTLDKRRQKIVFT